MKRNTAPRFLQHTLPGLPARPIVIEIDYKPTHSVEEPECHDRTCICHEAERQRLQELVTASKKPLA